MDNKELSGLYQHNEIKQVYSDIYLSQEPEDNWHAYSTTAISTFIARMISSCPDTTLCLHAGSGHWDYALGFRRVVALDIVHEALRNQANAIVGDLYSLPFRDGCFEVVLCVGSVLNYVDVGKVLPELARVVRPGGKMILEYERSRAWTVWGTRAYNSDFASQQVEYRGVGHSIVLYSDRFIEGIVRDLDIVIGEMRHFHIYSALVYRMFGQLSVAASLCFLDNYPSFSWLKNNSSNVIIECSKPVTR